MTARARILVVAGDQDRTAQWSDLIRTLGYDPLPTDPGAASAKARLARADGAVVESCFDGRVIKDLLTGRGKGPGVPVIVTEPGDAALLSLRETLPEAVPVRPTLAHPSQSDPSPERGAERLIRRRLATMIRTRTMADEWRRRHAVYTALGNEPVLPADTDDLTAEREATVLVAGDPSADYPLLESTLCDARTYVVASLTPAMTADYLERASFDVMILSVERNVDRYLPLISALRRNPRLVTTPVVMLSPRGGLQDPEPALRAGVTDIIERPLSPRFTGEHDWAERIRAHVSESMTRRALYDCLRALPPESFADPATDLAARAAFECYLAQMVRDHRTWPRPWSLGVFALTEARLADGRAAEMTDGLMAQAARIILALSRAEDFCARVGPREIALVMPNTDPDAGGQALARIGTALAATPLETRQGQPATIVPVMHVMTPDGEETPRAILARGLGAVRAA